MFLIFLGLFLISTYLAEEEIDYCKINKNHILCGANKDLKIENEITLVAPNNEKERNAFLHDINQFRNRVAGNEFQMGGRRLPPAENMLELEWCPPCEKAALNSIRNCSFDEYRNCCNCMNTGVMDLFPTHSTINYTTTNTPGVTLQKAFKNIWGYFQHNLTDFPYNCVRNVQESCFRGGPGFFASLFNAKQAKIGCAYVQCAHKKESMTIGYFQCFTNLDLHLDVIGKNLYSEGNKASKCSKRSETFKNLCKCNDPNGCIIKPAELSPNCTTRKDDTLTTLPPTDQVSETKPEEVSQTIDQDDTLTTLPPTNQVSETKPEEVSQTMDQDAALTTHPPTKHILLTTAAGIEQNPNEARPDPQDPYNPNAVGFDNQNLQKDQTHIARKRATTTTKRVSGLGGAGDASGANNLEDGDDFAFMFMMIWFLFIY